MLLLVRKRETREPEKLFNGLKHRMPASSSIICIRRYKDYWMLGIEILEAGGIFIKTLVLAFSVSNFLCHSTREISGIFIVRPSVLQ
jgi:hypothetical protein